jgi:drug/metabolite transporter (DMT)-like permease
MFTSTAYFMLGGTVIFGFFYLVTVDSSYIFANFGTSEYLMLVILSIFGALGGVCKAIAVQYEMASRVIIINYLQIIFMLIFDIFVVDETFNYIEIIGIIIVAASNACSCYVVFYKTGDATAH